MVIGPPTGNLESTYGNLGGADGEGVDRRKHTDTQGRSASPDDEFAAALRTAHHLFEVVSGGRLILPPGLVDPVLAAPDQPELAWPWDDPKDAA